jgi:hypothetical protein
VVIGYPRAGLRPGGLEELMPRILNGDIHPGRVFDRTVALEDVAEGYRLMNDREALKVRVPPEPGSSVPGTSRAGRPRTLPEVTEISEE